MTQVCVQTPHKELSKSRQVAWQVSLTLPLALLLVFVTSGFEPIAVWQTYSGITLLAIVITAATTDLCWCKIPNWLTYPAFGWAIAVNALTTFIAPDLESPLGTVGLTGALVGSFIPFCFMLVIFSLTGGGAGDVKLIAAMGAWIGLSRVIDLILFSFIFAGMFALVRAVWVYGPVEIVWLLYRKIGSWLLPVWIQPPTDSQSAFMKQKMPLGPSFALGALMVLMQLDLQWLLDSFGELVGG